MGSGSTQVFERNRESGTVSEMPTPRHANECVVEEWMAFLGHRWTALVLWHLSTGPKRFGALKDCLPGVTPKMLTERLLAMEERDLVIRHVSGFPREVSYQLSQRGRDLISILDLIDTWSEGSREKEGD